VPVIANLHPDLGDIAERVDNGRRLAPVECGLAPPTAIADYMARRQATKEPAPLEAETVERVGMDLGAARDFLFGSMKRLDEDRDQLGAADLHLRVGQIVNQIDDLAALLAERYRS
jgi:hypothetical protein